MGFSNGGPHYGGHAYGPVVLGINVTDVMNRACACLKSTLRIDVDKVHRASNWVLILYQTCTTIGLN